MLQVTSIRNRKKLVNNICKIITDLPSKTFLNSIFAITKREMVSS